MTVHPSESSALPPATVTLYVCPVCGTVEADPDYTGGHDFDRFPNCHVNERQPVTYVMVKAAMCREDLDAADARYKALAREASDLLGRAGAPGAAAIFEQAADEGLGH
jgi:hypothetical protein